MQDSITPLTLQVASPPDITMARKVDASIAGLHISFSPSGCNAVTLDGEGQAQLRVMEHSYGAENGLYDESMSFNLNDLWLYLTSFKINSLLLLHP